MTCSYLRYLPEICNSFLKEKREIVPIMHFYERLPAGKIPIFNLFHMRTFSTWEMAYMKICDPFLIIAMFCEYTDRWPPHRWHCILAGCSQPQGTRMECSESLCRHLSVYILAVWTMDQRGCRWPLTNQRGKINILPF